MRRAAGRPTTAIAVALQSIAAAGCNRQSCHQAANFGFNVVERPSQNPYPNQVFQPR